MEEAPPELWNLVKALFKDLMPITGPYEWQLKCGFQLSKGKLILVIPPGYGKSRVLISAALFLALMGFEVTVYYTSTSILK